MTELANDETIAVTPLVLVVDDDYEQRNQCKCLLEKQGFAVVTASGSRSAFLLFSKLPVDVLVTETLMPSMSGIALLSEMRVSDRSKKVPTIAISANPDMEELALGVCPTGSILAALKKTEHDCGARLAS